LALLLGAALGRIYLERRTSVLRQDWDKERRQVETLNKERDNLLIERETFTNGNYIVARARDMGLGAPIPGQVRRISLDQTVSPTGLGVAALDRR
jgi:cell division protein FtsL